MDLVNSDDVAKEGQGQGSCERFSDSRVTGMTNWRLFRQWGLRSGWAHKELPGNLMGTIWGFADHLNQGCFTYVGWLAALYTSIF